MLGLQVLFYPQTIFVSLVLLGLQAVWPQRRPDSWKFLVLGLAVAVVVLLPYAINPSPYGPVVTFAHARDMAEFPPGSRNAFFYNNPLRYWLFSGRSGLLPPIVPVTI